MVTKASGGQITGLLALTFEAESALAAGDPVMGSGDYECDKYDGTSPFLGICSVPNVKRTDGAFPTANTPGACTVEVPGYFVREVVANAAVTAGKYVVIDATSRKYKMFTAGGTYNTADRDREIVGIALTAAAALDDKIDVLFI